MAEMFWGLYEIVTSKFLAIEHYASVLMSVQWTQAIFLALILLELVSINRKLKK